jgi:hypothetical protein
VVQQSTTTAVRAGTDPGREPAVKKSDNSLLMSQASLKALKKRKKRRRRKEREIRK